MGGALNAGARAAFDSGAAYFLFTDADILHAPGSLRHPVAESESMKLGMHCAWRARVANRLAWSGC